MTDTEPTAAAARDDAGASAAAPNDGAAADQPVTEPSPKAKRKSGIRRFIRDVVVILLVAIVLSAGIKAFLFRSFYIPSESMQNTLQVNDRIVVNELVPDVVPLERGDVVVFRDPGGWLPSHPPVRTNAVATAVDGALTFVGLSASDSDDHLIKRVIGLPGDVVKCCNALGQMSVNGVPLDEKAYLKEPGKPASALKFSVTVPKNSLWVMGDNRNNSGDSRYNVDGPTKGFVPMSDVVGRAFVITWPAARWSWLDDYPTVFPKSK